MTTDAPFQQTLWAALDSAPDAPAPPAGTKAPAGVVVGALAAAAPVVAAEVVRAGIEAALKHFAANDGKTIAVAVEGACITLSGTVHSWAERDLATRCAWAAPGVRKVVDEMTVIY